MAKLPPQPAGHRPPVRGRIRTGLAVLLGVCVAVLAVSLTAAALVRADRDIGRHRSAALPSSPEPTQTPTAGPSPPGDSCALSASWAAHGETALLDAYIADRFSGSIRADELTARCPEFLPQWRKAKTGFAGGAYAVPAEVSPGTYETTRGDLTHCHWERGRQGQIQANSVVTTSKARQRVTIRAGDDTFRSQGCGNWIRAR